MTIAVRSDDNNHSGSLELHRTQPNLPAQFTPQVSAFTQWIDDARQLAPIAESLSKTSFVPKAFFGKPAEITAAILAGQEVGMSPMASLRAVDVIEGKPGMSAIALRALVQGHGHDIWVHESTATRAIVKGRRKGTDRIQESLWTIERAAKLGLTNKANWKNQPTAMLVARATSECARLVAADVILGMPYSTEELLDGADVEQEPTGSSETEPVKRTARRKPVERAVAAEPDTEPIRAEAAPQSEPERPVSAPPATGAGPSSRPPTDQQLAKMFATFKDAYITDKEGQLTYIAEVIGREVESRKELTAADVHKVIDSLDKYIAQNTPPVEAPLGGAS